MRLRSWCCELSTLVTVMIILQTVIYLSLTTLSTVLLLPDSYNYLYGQLVTVVIITLVISISGLLTNCLLLLGIRLQSHYLLIPWTLHCVLLVLGLLGSGTYLVLCFTIIGPHTRDLVLGVASSALIVMALFLICVLVLVVKLGRRIQQKIYLVRVASSIRGSRASINYNYKSNKSNIGSNKSNIDTPLSVRNNKSDFTYQNSSNNSEYQDKYKSNIESPQSMKSNKSDGSYQLSYTTPTDEGRRLQLSQATLDIPRCDEYIPDCSMSNYSMTESLHTVLPRHTSTEECQALYTSHTDTVQNSDSHNIPESDEDNYDFKLMKTQ